jgi:hypothetical protein
MQAGIRAGWVAMLMVAGWAPWAMAQAKPAKSEPPLRLRIWAERKIYKQGERIPIHVELTNVSGHDVFIGRELWTNASPARMKLFVVLSDGREVSGRNAAAEKLPAPAARDFADALLKWSVLLPAGYSYSSAVALQEFLSASDLVPGTYKIYAQYTSAGIKADTVFNPLSNRPDEQAKLQAADWAGQISANTITIRIVPK